MRRLRNWPVAIFAACNKKGDIPRFLGEPDLPIHDKKNTLQE